VVVDDAPAFGEALPNQREDAADIALVLIASQVPVPQNQCAIVADEMKLKVGEVELSHRGAIGVGLLIPGKDAVVSALHAAGARER